MLKHELSLQSPFKKHWSTFSRYRQTLHSGAPTKYQRDTFHEALLHEEHGLRIHIIRISEGSSMSRSVLTKSIILESLLLDIFSACGTKSGNSALVLDKETVQGIVSTMDSEWDKICLRVILRSIHSRKEIIVLGFDPDNLLSMTERVKFVVEEAKNANEAAANLIRFQIKFQEGKAREGDKRGGKPLSKENKYLVIQKRYKKTPNVEAPSFKPYQM